MLHTFRDEFGSCSFPNGKTRDWHYIRDWGGGQGGWNLRYFLADDSASEQKGFHEAFADMEPPVKCLLCAVHSQRTWLRN